MKSAVSTIRIAAPGRASKGEVIELKAMIRHPMETGYRRDRYGKQIPRHILKRFECRYNGEVVFAADFFPAVAADPFLTFYTIATDSGSLEFRWIDQDDAVFADTVALEVV
jgi:sulfur-oxidizing protein SoxZ